MRTLNKQKLERGIPKVPFCDSDSEFTNHAMDLWAYQNGANIDFSSSGKPTGNAVEEGFNGKVRTARSITQSRADVTITFKKSTDDNSTLGLKETPEPADIEKMLYSRNGWTSKNPPGGNFLGG